MNVDPRETWPIDYAVPAKLVAEHRLDEDEAAELAVDLAYTLPKQAYKL